MAGSSQNALSVSSTEVMIGLEATRGTAAATTLAVPVRSPKYKPDLTLEPDDSLQGSMVEVYNEIAGMRYDSHGWDFYPYLDTLPLYVAACLGSSDNKTAAGSATTLSAAATAGATTITTAAALAAGDWVVIGSGATLETHKINSIAEDVSTLAAPLIYAHASSTAVTPLTVHQWSLLNNSPTTGNQPLSCTINDFDGQAWRQLTAAQLSKLTGKGNATGLVDFTCDWFANAAVTPSSPSYSPSDVPPPPGWTTVISIDNTLVGYVEDWEVDLDRQVKTVPAITGTQEYYEYMANALVATGKVTVIEQVDAPQLALYEAGTQFPLDITMFDVTDGYACNLHCSRAMYKTGTLDRGAKGEVKVALDLELLPSSTDALAGGVSPIIVTVANATTTAYAGS